MTFSDIFWIPNPPSEVRNTFAQETLRGQHRALDKYPSSTLLYQPIKIQSKSDLSKANYISISGWLQTLSLKEDYSNVVMERKITGISIMERGHSKEFWELNGVKALGDRIKLAKAVSNMN